MYAILFSAASFLATLGGGLIVIRYQRYSRAFAAFAGGALVAVALFELFPASLRISSGLRVSIYSLILSGAAGFALLFLLNRGFRIRTDGQAERRRGIYGEAALMLHSFIEGMTIGLGFNIAFGTGLLVAAAIISHDFADGANTASLALNTGGTRRVSWVVLLADASMPVVGAVAGTAAKLPNAYLWLVLSTLAGALIYLGALELLPSAGKERKPLPSAILSIMGAMFIFGLSKIIS